MTGGMMLTGEQVERFKHQGFVDGGDLLDLTRVDALCDELDRVIEQREDPAVRQPVLLRNLSRNQEMPIWQIVNIWEASEPFRRLLGDSKVTSAIQQLTEAKALKVWHDQVQYKPAHTGGELAWHQDAPLWPILRPMTQVSAWIALDDVDLENGCMRMVPGSHKWGDRMETIRHMVGIEGLPETFEGHEVKAVACPVKRGHVHYHHALTWHASGANTSDRPRRAIAIHYMTDETRYVAAGEHVMKPFVEVEDGDVVEGKSFPRVWP